MLKKRRPVSKLLGSLIAIALSAGFLYAAKERIMPFCYLAAVVLWIFTGLGFLSLLLHTPERLAFLMRFRGRNWLIYLSMIPTIQALLVLNWYLLAAVYSIMIVLGLAWRLVGWFRLKNMSESELVGFRDSIIADGKRDPTPGA